MNSTSGAANRPLTTDGRAVAHRRRITERQTTAQRLLLEAMDETYDGDLDVNWSAEPESGKPWFPERLSTLYGSELWDRLTAEERLDLAKRELVGFLSFGIYVESILTMILFRDVAENEEIADDFTRYALKSIQEGSRNSFMFTRLVNVTELEVYRLSPVEARTVSIVAPLLPSGVISRGVSLLLKEAVHSQADALASDQTIQAHVRQVMRIQEMADSRQIEFARAELADALRGAGIVRRVAVGHVLAYLTGKVYPALLDSRIYQEGEISTIEAMRTAREGESGRRRARTMTDSFVRFATEKGLFRTPTERAILRRAGVLADRTTDTADHLAKP